MPYFETWSHENLVKFAKEAYEKLQRQEEELQRLRLLARREWVGLTDDDLMELPGFDYDEAQFIAEQKFARAIEAKLREKNS